MSFGRSETFTALLALLHYWDDEDFDKFVCTTFTYPSIQMVSVRIFIQETKNVLVKDDIHEYSALGEKFILIKIYLVMS